MKNIMPSVECMVFPTKVVMLFIGKIVLSVNCMMLFSGSVVLSRDAVVLSCERILLSLGEMTLSKEVASHPVNIALLPTNFAAGPITGARFSTDSAMPSMSLSRVLIEFVFRIVARARNLGGYAMPIGAKKAALLNSRMISGGGFGLFVACELRFAEDGWFATVAAANLGDLAPFLQASENDRDFGRLERTPFPAEDGVDVLQRVVAPEAIDGPPDDRGVDSVRVAEILQLRVNVALGQWWRRQCDRCGFQKSDLPCGRRRHRAGQQGRQERADIHRMAAAIGGRVPVEDFERREDAFPFEDFLPELFLAFFYFIASKCHAMQD
ncbi:MAG: hypothetical protein ABI318_23715, partial [Chthoniobacteraceae bacterium]